MNEKDPLGFDQHEPGAKLDDGKQLAGIVLGDFARALSAVCDVGTFGANKYTPHGWLSVPSGETRYRDAGFRHWLKEAAGEEMDPDSGLAHRAHRAWNALAELEFYLRRKENEWEASQNTEAASSPQRQTTLSESKEGLEKTRSESKVSTEESYNPHVVRRIQTSGTE